MTDRILSFKDAIREVLVERLEADPAVVLIAEDITSGGRYQVAAGFLDRFGEERVIETPLVEDMLVSIALGAALGKLRPVVEFIHPTMIMLGMSDVFGLGTWRYRMAKREGPPVIVRIPFGAYDHGRGPELSGSFLSYFLHMPGLIVAVPSTPEAAAGLLRSAFLQDNPVLFFEHKALYSARGPVPPGHRKSFGRADVVREGDSLTAVSFGYLMGIVQEAASALEKEGIQAECIDLNTLNPLDTEAIFHSVKKTRRLLIVEEDIFRGGVGAEIAALVAEKLPGTYVRRVASKNVPLAPVAWERLILPNRDNILEASRELVRL